MEDTERSDDSSRARKALYRILIVVAMGIGFGKIVSVDSVYDRAIQDYRMRQIPKTLEKKSQELQQKGVEGERYDEEMSRVLSAALADANKARPTLSANDRSRWATIRALVEPKARVYRYVPVFSQRDKEERVKELNAENADSAVSKEFQFYPDEILRNTSFDCPERFEKANWKAERYEKRYVPYAIDNVLESPGWDSIDVVKHGLKDEKYVPENPSSGYLYSSKPTLLPTVMAVPYYVLHRVFGLSLENRPFETARLLLVAYNLIPLGIAFLCLASLVDSLGQTDWGRFFATATFVFCSFALTFVATLNNHVPGFVCISVSLWATSRILRDGRDRWYYYALAGFFGAFSVACELPALAYAGLLCIFLLARRPKRTLVVAIPFGLLVAIAFVTTDYIAHQSFIPAYAHKRDHMALEEEAQSDSASEDANASRLSFDPNDWYYYARYQSGRPREAKNAILSHWAHRTGIDRGEPSKLRYAFHTTIGYRGVFSLSPIWIFSVIGAFALAFGRADTRGGARALGALTLILTCVFFAFYLTRPQGDRNYGGVACFPRWFFPLIPLYALSLVRALDLLSTKKILRAIAYLALFLSTASAFYPTWSPWVSPWLYQLAVDWNLTTPF